MKRKLKWILTLTLVLLMGGGAWAWVEYRPVLAELKEKDPDKFKLMWEEAKSFHFFKVHELYEEIARMTYEEVLFLRYRKWKEKRNRDDRFRLSEWERQVVLREETRQERKAAYERELREISARKEKEEAAGGPFDWEKAGAWEKSLILREKCIQYLTREKRDLARHGQIRKISRGTSVWNQPARKNLTVPELCENFVPITKDEQVVARSIQTLKEQMNYFYFIQLLGDLRIPKQTVFNFPTQLTRMTSGLIGF